MFVTAHATRSQGRYEVKIRFLASSLFRKPFVNLSSTIDEAASTVDPDVSEPLAAPSYRPQDPWERLLAKLDDVIGVLDSMGESPSAKGLLVYRALVTTKDTKGVAALVAALDESGPISGPVVQRLDCRGPTGQESSSSTATKRLRDLKRSTVEAAQAVLAGSKLG